MDFKEFADYVEKLDKSEIKKSSFFNKKFVFISDTHNLHEKLEVAPCDFLLPTGDFSVGGTLKELREFLKRFSSGTSFKI